MESGIRRLFLQPLLFPIITFDREGEPAYTESSLRGAHAVLNLPQQVDEAYGSVVSMLGHFLPERLQFHRRYGVSLYLIGYRSDM